MDEKTRLELDELHARIVKMGAEVSKMGAETFKLNAETIKIQKESRWYLLVVGAAWTGLIIAITKLLL